MAIVIIIKSEDGQTVELPIMGKISLGRSSASDYKITDSKMSGQHCTFSLNKNGELVFEDLNSTNGSYINNNKIHQSIVKINDVIRIGNTLIKIDEKKLTSKERMVVGFTNHVIKEEKTVPILTNTHQIKDSNDKDVGKPTKKPTIILNKDHLKKKKLNENNYMGNANENVIEQEESSGMTKMLKLDSIIKKKKA